MALYRNQRKNPPREYDNFKNLCAKGKGMQIHKRYPTTGYITCWSSHSDFGKVPTCNNKEDIQTKTKQKNGGVK